MKLSTLLESSENQFFQVEKPFTVWELTGHEASNHYYGSSRLHKPVYKKLQVEHGDEIHSLVGGMFAIEVTENEREG